MSAQISYIAKPLHKSPSYHVIYSSISQIIIKVRDCWMLFENLDFVIRANLVQMFFYDNSTDNTSSSDKDLFVRRVILGSEDSKGKFYGGLGASLVLAKYKETAKEPITFMPAFPLENSQYRTINLNGILGGEYNLGWVSVFGEAFYCIPTRVRVRRYMESYIITAARLGFQLGLKLPLNYQ